MIKILKIPKRYGTHADTCLLLGLAALAEEAQQQVHQKQAVKLLDVGSNYQIHLAVSMDPDEIAGLDYWNFFPPVHGAKTKMDGIPVGEVEPFNTVNHSEQRKRYRDWRYQGGKKLELSKDTEPDPADARTQNGVVLTSMRHDRNHNSLWLDCWVIREHFGALVASLLEAFSQEQEGDASAHTHKLFQARTGQKLPKPASAIKLFIPTAVQGVNRLKADNNKSSDSQKDDWVRLWLIAGGLFQLGMSERVKISDRVFDWRLVVLKPTDIELFRYREVLDKLRRFNPPSTGHGIARFDAEVVLKFSEALLIHHPANAQASKPKRRRRRGQSIRELVSGFSGTHFNSKGQVYGVKEVFSLGLPDWITPETQAEVHAYQKVLQEHLTIVQSLSIDEGHSELLAQYRDFITSSELSHFFQFQASYASYTVRKLADPKAKYPPKRFTYEGLNIMVANFKKDNLELTKITQNSHFLRVAKAINGATVYAGDIVTQSGSIKLPWKREYGLSQRLISQAGSKKDFIVELMAFLAKYENENLRVSEQLQKKGETLKRVWTRKEDLDGVIELIEEFGAPLVANLLVTYGYARWPKTKTDDKPEDTVEVSDDLETSAEAA